MFAAVAPVPAIVVVPVTYTHWFTEPGTVSVVWAIEAAAPVGQATPVEPVPCATRPSFVTSAGVPAGPCGPVAPVAPVAPVGPAGPAGPVRPRGPLRPRGPRGPRSGWLTLARSGPASVRALALFTPAFT